jgi:hypothetical protein
VTSTNERRRGADQAHRDAAPEHPKNSIERQSKSGDLEIIEERTMLEIPRGRDGREVLRVRFVQARTAEGREVAWHDVREFFRDESGAWRPGKKGISIRACELRAVADALSKAASGGQPAPAQREELPHEVYARLRSERRIR